jgi:hypothetical protein
MMQSVSEPFHPPRTAQQLGTEPLHNTDNEQLQAYQRKWDEELEGFRKLAAKLQAQASSTPAGGSTAPAGTL